MIEYSQDLKHVIQEISHDLRYVHSTYELERMVDIAEDFLYELKRHLRDERSRNE